MSIGTQRRAGAGDVLVVNGAASIDAQRSSTRVSIDIRNALTDAAGEPVGPAPGPPILSIDGAIEDVGHLLVGLLNAYSHLTGVPFERWAEVAEVQPMEPGQ